MLGHSCLVQEGVHIAQIGFSMFCRAGTQVFTKKTEIMRNFAKRHDIMTNMNTSSFLGTEVISMAENTKNNPLYING